LKEVSRYCGYADPLRRTVQARQSESKALHGGEVVEVTLCAVAQIEKVGIRHGKIFDIPFLQIVRGEYQPLRILVRKFPEQHTIRDAEDRGAGANRQGDSYHYCDCKYRTLAQRAKRVGDVIQHGGSLDCLTNFSQANLVAADIDGFSIAPFMKPCLAVGNVLRTRLL